MTLKDHKDKILEELEKKFQDTRDFQILSPSTGLSRGMDWEKIVNFIADSTIDYNKQNNSELNLITLCRSCHAKTNMKREKWIEFFKKELLK